MDGESPTVRCARRPHVGLILVAIFIGMQVWISPQAHADEGEVPQPKVPKKGDELPLPVAPDDVPLPDRLLGPGKDPDAPGSPVVPPPPLPQGDVAPPPPPTLPDRLLGATREDVRELIGPYIPSTDPSRASPLDLWLRRDPYRLGMDGVAHPRPRRARRVHGSVRLRYRGQAAYAKDAADDDDEDHDLYQNLTLSYGSPYEPGWFASFDGRLAQDLDAYGTRSGFNVFDSIDDTYDDRLTGRIYHAYAGYRPRAGWLEEIRVGRQYIDAGDQFHVDGARAAFDPGRRGRGVRWHAFAGAPAHIFDGDLRGFTAGGGVASELWRGATGRLDYAFIRDEDGFYGSPKNHLITAELRQRFNANHSGWARYSHLNGNPNYLDVVYDGFLPRHDVTLRGRVRTLLHAQDALTYGLDPYFAIVQSLEPFYELAASASKAFGERFWLEGGATGRWLYDRADEGRYNREFQRFFLTAGTDDWPGRHWHLGLTGEIWTGDETISTVSFDVTYEPSRRWRFELGSDYQLYRTDFYTDTERVESRSVYLRARWRPSERWRLHGRLRLEDDRYYTYWVVDMGAAFRF